VSLAVTPTTRARHTCLAYIGRWPVPNTDEVLLVGGAGDCSLDGCRRLGLADRLDQRGAGDGELGRFQPGEGELVGGLGDLLAKASTAARRSHAR